MAMAGLVKVTLLGPTSLEIEVFVPSATFTKKFPETLRYLQRKDKTTQSGAKAQSSTASRYQSDESLMTLKYLVKFDKCGEELTNAVFNPKDEAYGPVRPKVALVEDSFNLKGKEFYTTTAHAEFNLARVEPYPRKGTFTETASSSSNWFMDDISDEESNGQTQSMSH